MMIDIYRRFQPIESSSMLPFEVLVWRHDGTKGAPVTINFPTAGFAPGLLVGYIDGRSVGLPELDAELAKVGTNRDAIQALISSS